MNSIFRGTWLLFRSSLFLKRSTWDGCKDYPSSDHRYRDLAELVNMGRPERNVILVWLWYWYDVTVFIWGSACRVPPKNYRHCRLRFAWKQRQPFSARPLSVLCCGVWLSVSCSGLCPGYLGMIKIWVRTKTTKHRIMSSKSIVDASTTKSKAAVSSTVRKFSMWDDFPPTHKCLVPD